MLIPLISGAYEARSIIADAQKCVNLYPEQNPPGAVVPVTHYPTPGLTATGFSAGKACRWEYLASNGNMYSVFGDSTSSSLYVSTPSTTSVGLASTTLIGTFSSVGTTPVSMADNGIVLIIVDGTANGWALELATPGNFGRITDPNFLGASKVDYLDTFFIFNVPSTNQWFISLSEANYQMFTGVTGAILTGSIASPGTAAYTNGTYLNTSLLGGSGGGAKANITVVNNVVDTVTIVTAGTNYQIGDSLTVSLPGTSIATGTISAAGGSYTNGVYYTQPLTGGTGTGAKANITVAGGVVTSVVISSPGIGYAVSDVLSAALPAGSGFTYTVSTIGGQGFVYTVETIGGQAFDPLDVAAKTGYPDAIVGIIVMDLYIWLLGTQTAEIWFNAGAPDFPFQILPGVFIEHGCAAQYSIAKQDLSIYWLSQDKQGQCVVLKGNNYSAHRISTHAIEAEFSKYSMISDAIGWTYQQEGHVFYMLTFPTADKTWVWDETTQLWHQRASLQFPQGAGYISDGQLHKVIYHNAGAPCGGIIYVADDFGTQYKLDLNKYTENGFEVPRVRSFPHLVDNQNRVIYSQFIADMEVGTDNSVDTNDGTTSDNPPIVNLRWSDDRGKTYGNYISQTMGAVGQYLVSIQFQRLGMARDRVFELSWSTPTKTALNGAWINKMTAGS